MAPAKAGPSRWQRPRILFLGLLALCGVYAVGAAVTVPRVSRDLADRVAARLADSPSSTSPMSTAPTTVASSTTTASTTPTTTVPAPPLTASFTGGRLVLTGSVANNSQRSVLVAAAGVVDPANLDNRLTVDPSAPVEDDSVNLMAYLVAAMPRYLVQGEAGWNGATLFAAGVYADDASRVAFEQVATDVGATLTLNPRPQAPDADATSVEAELNTLVAEEPILFEWGSGTISATSRATVEKGFGETQLVLTPDGDEDPDKSRRVVFGVTATS